MNAFELFFQTARDDLLPAAVPVSSGMATVVFDVHCPHAEEMAFSASSRKRARVAIYACDAAQTKALHEILTRASRT